MAVITTEELVLCKYENDFVTAGGCACVDKLHSKILLESRLEFNREHFMFLPEKVKKMTCQARNRLVLQIEFI